MDSNIKFVEIHCDCIGICGLLRFYKGKNSEHQPYYWFQYYSCNYFHDKVKPYSTCADLSWEQLSAILKAILEFSINSKEKVFTIKFGGKHKFLDLHFGPHGCTTDIWLTHHNKPNKCEWEIVVADNYIDSLKEQIREVFMEELQKDL